VYSGCWVITADSKLAGGTAPSGTAGTLEQCRTACVNDAQCIAIAWKDAATECLTYSDATAATQPEQGTTLYQVNRACLGVGPFLHFY